MRKLYWQSPNWLIKVITQTELRSTWYPASPWKDKSLASTSSQTFSGLLGMPSACFQWEREDPWRMLLLSFSQKQSPTFAHGSHCIVPRCLRKCVESAVLQRSTCSTVGNVWYPHPSHKYFGRKINFVKWCTKKEKY